MIPHSMGFVLICITIGAHEHEISQMFPKFWIALKYIFRHILLIISTCDLELFRKLPTPMGNILWKLEDHIAIQANELYCFKVNTLISEKNSILCIQRRLVSRYTCIAHSVRCDVIFGSCIQVFRVTDSPGTVIMSDASNMRGQRSKVIELWFKM